MPKARSYIVRASGCIEPLPRDGNFALGPGDKVVTKAVDLRQCSNCGEMTAMRAT